ncbi:hypothetical protein KP509_05G099700 [Ceratopteris richardii]|uniref:Uncharacterized protein n=1 Tax=Ceratopteris richardii TaxID=49495 RepID=A0A8T2UPF5_CERRI|nr:hypothetical protein KP509_05G099700 [Ceratopteris richardii]KAH7437986.1 hypothetical protein KP509_05G099700 [Ceratopteris richardii]KAH7437987.1 hypothetical protein KP509_05G099700 [Ceratopteris richardii]KAH7437988.1 hypothetical protein KP509_05G099700 [Ceratopteris richardii]
MLKGKTFVETLMRENSFKGLFGAKKDEDAYEEDDIIAADDSSTSSRSTRKWVRELSSLANVVAARCARSLMLSIEELQEQFNNEISESAKAPTKYARNFLEYCCFRALAVSTRTMDYLSDKDFRRHTFEMMLAWEAPGAADKPVINVDSERAVGRDAFVRLGPAIAGVADPVTVYCQFSALTGATGGRLQFSLYDKYLGELDKTIKTMKSLSSSAHLPKLQMVKGENVIELEGTVTTQPVLQHVGVSTWPGRLTLTDHALYFESLGVVSYDKAKKFDLVGNLRQVVKPELTGPWGARLFDKAISCKSTAIPEPFIFEFPEFTGHARRDYWLVTVRELICTHQFARKYQLDELGAGEALSRAVLGIARLKATREVTRCLPDKPESLLTFLTCEEIPGGDLIMEAIARSLQTGDTTNNGKNGISEKSRLYAKTAAATIANLGATGAKKQVAVEDMVLPVGEFLIGELNPIEKAVIQSRDSSKRVELAKSTIDGVKVDGIDMNMAVMKELMVPVSAVLEWIKALQTWEEPFKSAAFLVICSYVVLKNLIGYIIPACLLCLAGFMLWFRQGQGVNSGEVTVTSPASQSTVEQLLALQQGLTELKDLLQAGNIFLLKLRAILFSTLPQATDQVVMVLVIIAFCLAILPWKLMFLLLLWEAFTRQTRFRQDSTERLLRRVREWWYSVPVVPVRLIKVDEEKKKN